MDVMRGAAPRKKASQKGVSNAQRHLVGMGEGCPAWCLEVDDTLHSDGLFCFVCAFGVEADTTVVRTRSGSTASPGSRQHADTYYSNTAVLVNILYIHLISYDTRQKHRRGLTNNRAQLSQEQGTLLPSPARHTHICGEGNQRHAVYKAANDLGAFVAVR